VIGHSPLVTPSSARVRVPAPQPNSKIVSPGSKCNMCRAVQARHQIRISFNLSWCVQYLSETRSRSAIDRIAEEMTAFRPTGGGASKFPWTINETSSLTETKRGVRQPSPTFDFLRARMY
jgi:hypothetical protein